ncbi:hypothetical protein A0H81_02806 [Grifola frondosa]|uniref:Uncharacterized protein n=1 Tax=Grifola frondosa TaxID=5627 RepID=A0A1C7MP78_GRIFR|nr:hypothetical protein A0H81_02806 [Grifola frondosa]
MSLHHDMEVDSQTDTLYQQAHSSYFEALQTAGYMDECQVKPEKSMDMSAAMILPLVAIPKISDS